jgi:hypothetical protein
MSRNDPVKSELSEADQAVRAILLKHWDPIGIKTEPDAQDEYNSYVPEVVALGSRGRSADVAAYLAEIETRGMGLRGDWVRCTNTVKLIEDYFRNGVRV